MLFFGDIHINSNYKSKMLKEIVDTLSFYKDEKNIIFAGDYVYHFSYDRHALLELYSLFVSLFKEGKNIYVLAGNHDRLGNSFVFEEAKKAFDIINQMNDNKLHFITKPEVFDIESKKVLFLPYVIDSNDLDSAIDEKSSQLDNTQLRIIVDTLKLSNNKNEKLSAAVNETLLNYSSKFDDLLVVHHYYINNTIFPGQKSRFSYKDVAISDLFLDFKNLKLISGHLHQTFVHKNYLCLGSVWATSSLETNQIKGVFYYNTTSDLFTMTVLNTGVYVLMDFNKTAESQQDFLVNDNILDNFYNKILENTKANLTSSTGSFNINIVPLEQISYENISLQLIVDDLNYDKVYSYLDEPTQKKLKEVRLKKTPVSSDLESFKIDDKNLMSFADRKNILKDYISKKYPSDFQKYYDILSDLKLV